MRNGHIDFPRLDKEAPRQREDWGKMGGGGVEQISCCRLVLVGTGVGADVALL